MRAFQDKLTGHAEEASRATGIPAKFMLGQAALESGWGRREIKGADGTNSNNLFGIKAGGQWSGASVNAGTQEYENGSAISTTGQFRAYDSRAQSFQDYVSLLRNSPRYAAALNTGSNVHAFAAALQRGGYATDPDYASKISSIAGSINPQPATQEPSLKSASARPINPTTGIL